MSTRLVGLGGVWWFGHHPKDDPQHVVTGLASHDPDGKHELGRDLSIQEAIPAEHKTLDVPKGLCVRIRGDQSEWVLARLTAALAGARGADLRPERIAAILSAEPAVTLAAWATEGRLVLYRSPTSVETIFWKISKQQVRWHTNPLKLLGGPPGLSDLDLEVIAAKLVVVNVTSDRTCYRDVNKLQPATILTIDRTGHRSYHPVHFFQPVAATRSLAEAAAGFREHIAQSIRRNLAGVRRAAIVLSGGLDSAILAYEANKLTEVVGIHWSIPGIPGADTELEAARSVAHALDIDLRVVEFPQYADPLGETILPQGQLTPFPYMRGYYPMFFSTAQVAAAMGADVVLSGLYADELSVGHAGDPLWALSPSTALSARARAIRLSQLLGAAPELSLRDIFDTLRRPRRRYGTERRTETARIISMLSPATIESVQRAAAWEYELGVGSVSTRASYSNLMCVLTMEDEVEPVYKYSIFGPNELDFLHPFLTPELWQYALSLDGIHRSAAHGGSRVTKVAWRAAYLGILPGEIVRRDCSAPYAAMVEQFCRNHRTSIMTSLGDCAQVIDAGFVDPTTLSSSLESGEAFSYGAVTLLGLYALEAWLQQASGSEARPMRYRNAQ